MGKKEKEEKKRKGKKPREEDDDDILPASKKVKMEDKDLDIDSSVKEDAVKGERSQRDI